MEHSVKTLPGTWYTITSTAPATVTELIQGETATLATLKESGTASFRPSTTQITVNTEGKFTVLPTKAPGAPFPGTGGNVQFTVDQTYSATSENAQSGVAVAQATANCLQNGGSIGGLIQISDWHYCQTKIGYSSHSAAPYCCSIGARSQAHHYSTALGYQAKATVGGTMALGANITVKDTGVAAIAINNEADASASDNLQTILYIISEGSTLANTYADGEACLGYIVRDNNGNIQKAGTRKLSELLTNNTTFAPATLDLDSPAPKVFLPTGITDPIETPQQLENEPEILTDTQQ